MLRLFRHYVPFPAVTLAVLEAALFFTLANILMQLGPALWQRFGMPLALVPSHEAATLPLSMTVVAFLAMSSLGLYNRQMFRRAPAMAARAAVTFPLVLVALLPSLWLFGTVANGDYRYYYALSVASLALFFPLALVLRGLFIELVSHDAFQRRVLIVGTGRRAARIADLLEEDGGRAVAVVGYVRCGNEEPGHRRIDPLLPSDLLTTPNRLAAFVGEEQVDEIVVATSDRRGLPVRPLLDCKLVGAGVSDYHTFFEGMGGRLDLEELNASWLIFSDGFKLGRVRLAGKRAFDLAVSLAFLLFTLPLTLAAALAIKLTSTGPVFYRQERVGLDGRVFSVLKFRTMRVDAEKDGPQWASAKDPRVTPVGTFLRKSRIDEIPQIVNVLLGQMSFIGPRPERPMFVEQLAARIPYYQERHRVKPGITGWAQVNYPYGASEEDARNKLAYDLYYLKNCGLFLDVVILMQTVRVILWREGAR